MVYDSKREVVVLFGNGQTWEWAGGDWMQRHPANSPPAVRLHAMAYDAQLGRTVLFSGQQAPYEKDTWFWDGVDWTRLQTSVLPLERETHAMAFDAARGNVVLFGGSNNGRSLDDTWVLQPSVLGRVVPFGNGCRGSAGTPTLRSRGGSVPWIGETLELEVTGVPSGVLGVPFGMLGASRDRWLGHVLPLALDPIGMPGCVLLVAPELVQVLTHTSGVAQWTLPIPNLYVLVGQSFFVQGVILDRLTNPLGAITSDAAEATIGVH
jgi:hypothetical protein